MLATQNWVNDNFSSRPYKVYTALLTQSGTSAPVAMVLENTLGGTVEWSYVDVGIYRATLTGAFTTNKTMIVPANIRFGNGDDYFYVEDLTTDKIEVTCSANSVIPACFNFEIRVYN